MGLLQASSDSGIKVERTYAVQVRLLMAKSTGALEANLNLVITINASMTQTTEVPFAEANHMARPDQRM